MSFGMATATLAYVGPGPGLSLTWALVGLVGTVLSAVVAVLFWPVKRLLRRGRDGSDSQPGSPTPASERSG